MSCYDPQSIIERYTQYDELHRLRSSADTEIMYQVERWFIKKYLPREGIAIDVGGGPGRYAVEMAKMGMRVLLTDITPKNIEQARNLAQSEGVLERFEGFKALDILELKRLPKREYSFAVCYGMLNYLLDYDIDALKAIKTLLRPGSYLIVSVMGLYGAVRHAWSSGRLQDPDYRLRERAVIETGINSFKKPYRKFYTSKLLEQVIITAGLQIVEMASTPVVAASLGTAVDEIRQDKDAWDYLLEIEKHCCTLPGLLDVGQHIIAVARTELCGE